MKQIIELPVVVCEDIESLASRLNQELLNGKAIRFRGSNGVFTRRQQGRQQVGQFVYRLRQSETHDPNYWALRDSFEEAGDFFKVARWGDTFRHSQTLDPNQKGLIYGPRDLPIGEYPADGNTIFYGLNSPKLGPVVGSLIPSEYKDFFRFQSERLCYNGE